MLKKYPVHTELSKELQTIYTLIEAKIMETENKNPWDALLKALVGAIVAEIPALAESALHAIFDKHRDVIVKAATPVTANDIIPCDPGYTRDASGKCVKDPLPGDPTHQ